MPPSFEWEIQDNAGPPRRIGAGPTPPEERRKRIIRVAALILLLIMLATAARAWTVIRRQAVNEARSALRDSVELELKSIANGDEELFHSRQDPVDSAWWLRQVARYLNQAPGANPTGLFPAPGLKLSDRPLDIQEINISGRSGRVELTHWFETQGSPVDKSGNEFTARTEETGSDLLPFRIAWFYRQADDGTWYHVAPPDDYLGIPYSWHGSQLEIRATSVEAQLLDSVAADLVSLVLQTCRQLGCPEDTRYVLSFEDIVTPVSQGGRWTLPAPYLTGLPENEEARATWRRAVKSWMFENLVREHATAKEVSDRIIFRQLAARLGAEMGLATPVAADIELLTQAVIQGQPHTLQSLWEAEFDPYAPQATQLLEAEIAAFLDWLADQVGSERLFELIPALSEHYRPSEAALFSVFDLERDVFTAAWFNHLSELTGQRIAPLTTFPVAPSVADPLIRPPLPVFPPVAPGNQIALVCDGRIWVGNVDGSAMAPLTLGDHHFFDPRWSPDGHWLLTRWLHDSTQTNSALFLLEPSGVDGRLLTDDPASDIWYPRWSPDGSQVVFENGAQYVAVDVETGEQRYLPDAPVWSPNGENLAFVAGVPRSVWLADASWENPKQIVIQAELWGDEAWAPDSSKLGLTVSGRYPHGNSLATFDLETGQLVPLVSLGDLTAMTLHFDENTVSDGTDPHLLVDRAQRWLSPFGWSADGGHLLVWGQGTVGHIASNEPTLLAAFLPDGSSPYLVAYGSRVFGNDITWSPTNPDRLTFTWRSDTEGSPRAESFLFDLEDGVIYSTTDARRAVWSPDGTWLALVHDDQVVIVDSDGQERFILAPTGGCSDVAWNPAAEFTDLQQSLAIGALTD